MSDSVQLAEQYALAGHKHSKPSIHLAKDKSIAIVIDKQQGSYSSGLVEIDSAMQLAGSHGYASLAEAYITVPYVVTARNTGGNALTAALTRFAVGLKANVCNVVDSCEVELNGKTILTHSEYKNFWTNLRLQTETSVTDLAKHESDLFLAPDDWVSIDYSSVASTDGDGYVNNAVGASAPLDSSLGQADNTRDFNDGFFRRLNMIPMPIDSATTHDSFGWPSLRVGASREIARQAARGCWQETASTAANTNAGIWYYMLKIRLSDLHPLFKEIDLLANPQIRLRLRFNAGTAVIDATAANAMRLNAVRFSSGRVCPIMVASAATNNPLNGCLTTNNQLSVSFGVLQNEYTTFAQSGDYFPYTTTRLNIPMYEFNDERSIIANPVKKIRFLDCYTQYFDQRAGIGAISGQHNASFNFQLSATLKNIKYVWVMPFAETSSGHWAVANGTQQFASPFDSAPWTCMPGALIRNFQVSVGNKNVFSKTHEFDYEQFLDEFAKISSLDGDINRKVNCGLISLDKWTYSNHVLIADCSRISEPDVMQSVVVSGTNANSQGMNILIGVVYERELEVDVLTGTVERSD